MSGPHPEEHVGCATSAKAKARLDAAARELDALTAYLDASPSWHHRLRRRVIDAREAIEDALSAVTP